MSLKTLSEMVLSSLEENMIEECQKNSKLVEEAYEHDHGRPTVRPLRMVAFVQD